MTEPQNINNKEYVLKTKPSAAPDEQQRTQESNIKKQGKGPSSSQAFDKQGKKGALPSIIIVTAIVVVSLVALIGINIYTTQNAGSYREAVVYDGDGGVHHFPLDEDGIHLITSSYGENTVEIQDGTVRVTKADCANQICVETAPISQNGETIVCLPHKLYVTIADSKDDSGPSVDAVAS